ncbi:NAD(P)/FAD-dependent oxidoreductase [Vibrio sp. SM6]|uniref:NAD(P)/FAD-dependent oxidoreductase n=1 Tax=Vibrio agarilyticus TaxID=2726741 RepID=A0A7X8TNW6_9VIBR|nr:NAD(P)/FAD-dependent oxidoreductase [Vibrio agarilyticus]NLS11458.1 NAD(P)/FAD-dependent oxidoreductase [Vibrio agarilyticus]
MKIAIIGTGISGLTCGYYLHHQHDITLYEANDYIGGHTATRDVEHQGKSYQIDTGFIVYNDRTYPHFNQLMAQIGVTGTPTQMSFSVRNDSSGLEYNGHTLSTLFAQKRNLLNPRFYRLLFDILRFNRLAKAAAQQELEQEITLGEFLRQNQFNDYFSEHYILPMGAAIWSSTLADMRAFPLHFFSRFFLNHGLLDITNRPQWSVINGGSRAYIAPLTRGFADKIRLNSPVECIERTDDGVLITALKQTERFDAVILACHSDQALKLLYDPSDDETRVMGQLRYQPNDVILHTDTSVLPKRSQAWAAWNYWLEGDKQDEHRLPALTYNMNILQHIQSDTTFCVSLNSREKIDPAKIIAQFTYDHPVFDAGAMGAQQERSLIQGQQQTWFCGAYWYNGFHEDGVRSALDVVQGINDAALAAVTKPARQETLA